jgi:hypothetical protein
MDVEMKPTPVTVTPAPPTDVAMKPAMDPAPVLNWIEENKEEEMHEETQEKQPAPANSSSRALLSLSKIDDLLSLAGQGGEGKHKTLIGLFKKLPTSDHEDFWQRVMEVALPSLERDNFQLTDNGEYADESTKRVIHATAVVMCAFTECLDANQGQELPESFAEVLGLCQDILLEIPDRRAQSLIARSLELICVSSFQGREDFYGGLLMFLLGRCLEPKASGADVSRLHRVRAMLLELDWEHESIESLKMQLCRLAMSPAFCRAHHGTELLACMYSVSPGFTTDVHGSVKNQVPYAKTWQIKSYSIGLLKAWKGSEAGTKVQIEQCLQDWILLAIRANSKMAAKARGILEEFHRHHHEPAVNELLCRLYAPVLFRSLKVANWQVRMNATILLSTAYPLVPNGMANQESEQELTRQHKALRDALTDPCELIRRAAVASICRILTLYWDMIPVSETAEILQTLIMHCACDQAAPQVRAAVADGFGTLLDNALSHNVMAAVLPRTAQLLNDKSPVVRFAFVKLLTKVNLCKNLSCQDIVTKEGLLNRLAIEHEEGQAERLQRQRRVQGVKVSGRITSEAVAQGLTRLLAPSLFDRSLHDQVERVFYLLKRWPLPLLALLSNIDGIVPPSDMVKLAAALLHFGLKQAKESSLRTPTSPTKSNQSTGPAPPTPMPTSAAQRTKWTSMLLLSVGVLLERSMEQAKNEKGERLPAELEDFVYKHIKEDDFWELFSESTSRKIQEDLLFVASFLDPARLPRTRDLVRRELAGVALGEPTEASWRAALLQVASQWGLMTEVFGPVWEVMSLAIRDLGARTSESFRKGPAGVEAALQVLDDTMQHSLTRRALLNCSRSPLTQILQAVQKAFCGCWSSGLEELRQPECRVLSVLGPAPAPALWPKVMGLTLRLATHLEFKGKLKHEKGPLTLEDLEAGSVTSFITSVSAALCGEPAMLALQAAEDRVREIVGAADEQAQNEPPEKRPRNEQHGAFPSDMDAVLMIVQRILETINYVSFLGGEAWPAASLPQGLEDVLWRWSVAADVLSPKATFPSWKEEAWCWMSRMLRQTICTDRPVFESMVLFQKMLNHVSDEEPEDEHIGGLLSFVFSRLQNAPQLKTLIDNMKRPGKRLKDLVKNADDGVDAEMQIEEALGLADGPVSPSDDWICHPRVAQSIVKLLPTFRGLSGNAPGKDSPAEAAEGSAPNEAPLTPRKSQDGIDQPEQEKATEVRRGAKTPLEDKTNVQEDAEMSERKSNSLKTPKTFSFIADGGEGEGVQVDAKLAEMAMASVGLQLKPTPQSGRRLSSKTKVYVDPDLN